MKRKVGKSATPPSNAKALNSAALTQLDDPKCREAIARLACSEPGVALLREAQAALVADTVNKLNELLGALEAVTKALSDGAAWGRVGAFVFVDGCDVTPMVGTVRIGDKATVYWRECGEMLSLFVARADGLSALALLYAKLPRPSEPFKPVNRASLPQLHRITAPEGERLQAAELPAIYGGGTEPPELWLPGMEPEIPGCPSWLLVLFEQAGGVSSRQGRGAPWPMHIFIAAFLHLNIGDRNGEWRQLRFSREYVESWLHPDGWDKDNRRKHWHRFPEALHAVDRLRVYVPGVGDVRLVGVDTIPQKPTDALVDLRVRIPRAAAHGARIDWPTLCKYRRVSSVQYRAYLSVVALMDWTARKGAPITREIGKPILKADGSPKRKRGGRIVRSTAALIPHPNASLVQAFTDADLARLIGLDPNKRNNPGRARGAFEQLEADGIFEGEWTKDGKLRLYGPRGKT